LILKEFDDDADLPLHEKLKKQRKNLKKRLGLEDYQIVEDAIADEDLKSGVSSKEERKRKK
jgi:hypothetical protein